MEVSIGETSKVVEQSDGSYKLTYEVDGYSLGDQKITVKVTTKGSTKPGTIILIPMVTCWG